MALAYGSSLATGMAGEPRSVLVQPFQQLPPGDWRPAEVSSRVPEVVEPAETLEGVWALVLQYDPTLQARQEMMAAADAALRAQRSERWPVFSVDGSYAMWDNDLLQVVDTGGLLGGPVSFPARENDYFSFNATARIPLFTSHRIGYAIKSAEAEAAATATDTTTWRRDLKLRIAGDYLAVLRAECEVDVVNCMVRSLTAHAYNVELFFQHNRVPRNDLLTSQVALSNAHQTAIRTRNQLDVARATLNRRLGRPLTSALRLVSPRPEAVQLDLGYLTGQALASRAELARLTARADSLLHEASSIAARNRPQVEMRGDYAFQQNQFRSPQGLAGLSVGVSWTPFDSGAASHRASALQHHAASLHRLRADLESQIQLEVRRAWLEIDETRQRLGVSREDVARADENLRIARERYEVGSGTNTEVLDAEYLIRQSLRNQHGAWYDAVYAVLRLRHATGDL